MLLFIYAPLFVIGIDSQRETALSFHKIFDGCQPSYHSSSLLVQFQSTLTTETEPLSHELETFNPSSPLPEQHRSLEQAAEVFILNVHECRESDYSS